MPDQNLEHTARRIAGSRRKRGTRSEEFIENIAAGLASFHTEAAALG